MEKLSISSQPFQKKTNRNRICWAAIFFFRYVFFFFFFLFAVIWSAVTQHHVGGLKKDNVAK